MRFTRYLKKFALFSATFTVAFLSTSNTWAAEISTANMERYLQNIQNYTYKILSTINDFPVYLTNTSMLALSWLKPDDSDATATMQGNFTTLGNIFATNLSAQTDRDLQLRLTANLLGITNIADLTNPPDSPKVLTTIPNINDITYTSLVGSPPIAKNASTAPYNYILNAGGLNITHGYLPNSPAMGNRQDADNYKVYYNTVNAIQSFNGYVLGGFYNESKNGNAFSAAQMSLVQQATQSSWFTQIASEELGKVLRQILMFQSQTYVLLTQLIQTQKQLLLAQTMTNTLLILNNKQNESLLYSKALGLNP